MTGYQPAHWWQNNGNVCTVMKSMFTQMKTLILHCCWTAKKVVRPSPLQALISHEVQQQNRSANFIHSNFSHFASVSQMKCLHLFRKIYYGKPSVKQTLFSSPASPCQESTTSLTSVYPPRYSTKQPYTSFVQRTSLGWDHLPSSIVSIEDPSLFKSSLCDHLL